MKSTRNTERIIEILDLLNNEQRSTTIDKYITYIISSLNEASIEEIISFTQVEFEISLSGAEVSEATNQLVKNSQLVLIGEKYKLTESAKVSISTHIEAGNQQEQKLKDSFCKNILSITDVDLTEEELNHLFKEFKGYIHENFFFYGQSAINILSRNDQNTQNLTTQQVFKVFSNNLPHKLRKVFYTYIENLASNSSASELRYYESLADRAEQFFALGLSKELAQELAAFQPLDWTILVDTNFLFSALKIHANTENPAVDSLLKIINENKDYFKINFYYLKPTYKELLKIKPVLRDFVHSQILTTNQINVALQSENLDSFTKAYYQNQLLHGNASQHPTTIVDNAISILRSKKIEIYNGKVKGVEQESSHFMDAISDYSKYQGTMNEARIERRFYAEVRYKNIDQLEHDVYLREAILSLREQRQTATSTYFQDCKVFGLTLDFGLINYDKHAGRRENGHESFIPSFLTPSYLLKKLYKFLPVISDDYRKAFLSSIASPVFSNADIQKSQASQSALSVFHALGIDDISTIAKSLTSKIFLDEIKNTGGDINKIIPFVESEISKELKIKENKEKRLFKELKFNQESLDKTTTAYNNTLQTNSNLADERTLLEQRIETLNKGLKANKKNADKLQSILAKVANLPQPQLPFSNEQDLQEIERLKKIVKEKEDAEAKTARDKKDSEKELFLQASIRTMQKKSLRRLIIPSVALALCVLYSFYSNDWDLNKILAQFDKKSQGKSFAFIASTIITFVLFVYNAWLVKNVYDTHLNNSNIKSFRDMVKLPDQLK